jgi:hypothetical protein
MPWVGAVAELWRRGGCPEGLNFVDALVCQDDPTQRQRPNFHRSRGVEGETAGRRLDERQAGPDRPLDRELATSPSRPPHG